MCARERVCVYVCVCVCVCVCVHAAQEKTAALPGVYVCQVRVRKYASDRHKATVFCGTLIR